MDGAHRISRGISLTGKFHSNFQQRNSGISDKSVTVSHTNPSSERYNRTMNKKKGLLTTVGATYIGFGGDGPQSPKIDHEFSGTKSKKSGIWIMALMVTGICGEMGAMVEPSVPGLSEERGGDLRTRAINKLQDEAPGVLVELDSGGMACKLSSGKIEISERAHGVDQNETIYKSPQQIPVEEVKLDAQSYA